MFPRSHTTVSQNQLETVIEALRAEPRKVASSASIERQLVKIINQGWCESWQFDDLMMLLDRGIGRTHLYRPDELSKQLKLEERFAFRQEFDPDEGPWGTMMFSAATVACVLIWFERLGFDVDPTFICKKLAEAIDPDRFVNQEEITVLTYPRLRHAMAPVALAADNPRFAGGKSEEFIVGSGYRAVVLNDADGLPVSLEVHAPKYVEPRPQVSVTCDECLMTYTSGIRSDEHRHDIEHNKIVTTLRPRTSRALKRAMSKDPEAVWVTPQSPKWMSIAVYRRARAFKREFGYDFTQWEVGDEADATGFLFNDADFRIVGACCFRPESSEEPEVTRLDWIWICPDMRRVGLLSKNWDRFRDRFGEFRIEPPISEAMQTFLRKRGDDHLIR